MLMCLLILHNREGYWLRLALECVVFCALVVEVPSLSDTSADVARCALLLALYTRGQGKKDELLLVFLELPGRRPRRGPLTMGYMELDVFFVSAVNW